MADLRHLLDPCTVAGLALRNRVVMAPMTRSRATDGAPGQAVADYYARRAAAGVGLIITEGTGIARPGALDDPGVPQFHGREALSAWKVVVDAVHAAAGKIAPQLWHVGAFAGRRAAWTEGDWRIESASGLRGRDDPFGRAMTDTDIADTIAAYACAASDAERLGFDAVEIHGAHGYLIDQFFWDGTNLRSDRWGGASISERTRFAVEIVSAIRRAVSPGFPVIFRFSQFKQQDYAVKLAHTPGELASFLEPLAGAGVDIFHASQRRFWDAEFSGSDLNTAGWARHITGRPSITVGSVGLSGDFQGNMKGSVSQPASLERLLDRLERQEFDLVAIGRALLVDPQWVEKIENGRFSDLRSFDVSALANYY